MFKERELIKDMKILLECTDMGGLQRNADNLIGRAIELLAQPEQSEQEPVAWMSINGNGGISIDSYYANHKDYIPLYTAPQKREPLTRVEIDTIWTNNYDIGFFRLARLIEKAHGIGS